MTPTSAIKCGVTTSAFFKGSIFISGWVLSESDPSLPLIRADIVFPSGALVVMTDINRSRPDIEANPHCGFQHLAHGLSQADADQWSLYLWFVGDIEPQKVEYPAECITDYPSQLFERFRSLVQSTPHSSLLEIGSRARSGNVWKELLPVEDYLGMDVLPGQNVDVVGDAHSLSEVVQGRTFDFIFALPVFEHLLMPWKVAIEMNTVLKEGGIVFIGTHQTIGLHDIPWDYWRFSKDSWHGLFNASTGFEVVSAEYTNPMFITPFRHMPQFHDIDQSAGFYGSSVMVKKIGASVERWQSTAKDVVQNMYPE